MDEAKSEPSVGKQPFATSAHLQKIIEQYEIFTQTRLQQIVENTQVFDTAAHLQKIIEQSEIFRTQPRLQKLSESAELRDALKEAAKEGKSSRELARRSRRIPQSRRQRRSVCRGCHGRWNRFGPRVRGLGCY